MTNRVTAVMLAAATMKPVQIYEDVRAREQWPYKADTPEHGLDVPRIRDVAHQMRGYQYVRDAIILLAAVIGLFNLYSSPSPEDYPFGYYASPEPNWLGILLTVAVIAATQFFYQCAMRARARAVLREVADETSDSDTAAAAAASAQCELIISGGFSPFVGSGSNRRSWSFTVDLQKPADESAPVRQPTVEELYAETGRDIEALRLPKLTISDVVCVDGRDATALGASHGLGGHRKPPRYLPPTELAKLVGQNHSRMRHYKVLRANLWGGQLVFSVFFRYVIQGDLLFVESRIFELPPLKKEFLEYESMPGATDAKEIGGDITSSVFSAPFIWIPIALRVVTFLFGGWATLFHNRHKTNADAIDRDRKFNYGWPSSLREHWAASEYERFFQGVDIDFYEKSIKDALLDSLLSSLQQRNISVEAFKSASTTIFNDGIIMSGGSIAAQSIAAGTGAAAITKMVESARGSIQKQKARAEAKAA